MITYWDYSCCSSISNNSWLSEKEKIYEKKYFRIHSKKLGIEQKDFENDFVYFFCLQLHIISVVTKSKPLKTHYTPD